MALATAPSSSCHVNMAEGTFTEQTPRFSRPGCGGCWRRLAAIFFKFKIASDFILGKPRCSHGTVREWHATFSSYCVH